MLEAKIGKFVVSLGIFFVFSAIFYLIGAWGLFMDNNSPGHKQAKKSQKYKIVIVSLLEGLMITYICTSYFMGFNSSLSKMIGVHPILIAIIITVIIALVYIYFVFKFFVKDNKNAEITHLHQK